MTFSDGVIASMKALAAEDALGVLHQRRGGTRQLDAVVRRHQRRDGHIEHRELVAQQELLLGEHRRQLVANMGALLVGTLGVLLEGVDMGEQLKLEGVQQLTGPGA
jgi:hypothetical protein